MKILVHVLNEKLESTNFDFSEQMDEIRRSREQLQRMKELEEENEKVIKENNLLQDKLDELLNSMDAAYDRIDELSKIVNEKDDELIRLK